jgi:shikimate kinase
VRAVVLVGFMGSGKSSVGRALASQLNWRFEDLDERIERRNDRTIAEIFREFGEAEFRRMEHEVLKELLEELASGAETVIALGGGAFIHESNIQLVEAKKISTVFLDAAEDELWRRCIAQQAELGMERPLLTRAGGFRELYQKRRPYYLRASTRQETDGKMVEQIAAELVQTLGLGRRGEKRGPN